MVKKSDTREFTTPMMRQYSEIKKAYQDVLLLYRLGDFYELFLDDALIASQILQITLTRRPRGRDGDIPMAGVPYHAAERYIHKLVSAGHKVAICEQVSEPDAKGIVERKVVRVITPGTVLDEQSLDTSAHNYVMSIALIGEKLGVAVVDISTGDCNVTQLQGHNVLESLKQEISRFRPSECVLSDALYASPVVLETLTGFDTLHITRFSEWDTYARNADEAICSYYGVHTVKSFGFTAGTQEAAKACAGLLGYISSMQCGSVPVLRPIQFYYPDEYVVLDAATVANLEIFESLGGNGGRKGTLVDAIDATCSAAGGRLLKVWLTQPLRTSRDIRKRQESVQEFLRNRRARQHLRAILKTIYDCERILAKISSGLGNAADLVRLSSALHACLDVRALVHNEHMPSVSALAEEISEDLRSIEKRIRETFVDDPPLVTREGGMIREGVHSELDRLRSGSGGTALLEAMEERERQNTGIPTLRIRSNKIFGYYIEVGNAHKDTVPERYQRRQTLVNAERFVTDELLEYEAKAHETYDKCCDIEYSIFMETVTFVLSYSTQIQEAAAAIAKIDVLSSFAHNADESNYCIPVINEKGSLSIVDGRHPVVEKFVGERRFVPNSTSMSNRGRQLHMITGPNMAGKSVYIRQVAHIVLLAHIGSCVPARQAEISLIDRLFVRSGASDHITSGLSTFMVEMVETAHILHHATQKSLIILDEIGRGTSTFDGISIAWAVAAYLIRNKTGPKTLFATHYHELQQLVTEYPHKVQNMHMAVEDHNNRPIFLYTVVEGSSSHSYGIAVAQLAGVPIEIIHHAKEMLLRLETGGGLAHSQNVPKNGCEDIVAQIQRIKIDSCTPMQALTTLAKLHDAVTKA